MNSLTERRAISTIVGGILFISLMITGMVALISFMAVEDDLLSAGRVALDREIEIINHDFEIKSVCTDSLNNLLFIEINNLGSQHLEMADVVITNKTISSKPATVYDVKYSDAFVPFSSTGSILKDQPLTMTAGTYGIKVVSTLGVMQNFNGTDGFIVYQVADPGGDLDETFVSAGAGGLDASEGLVFDSQGNLYVSSEKSDNILRYDSTGIFDKVFASGNGLKKPLGITFGPDNHLYIANENDAAIYRFDGTTGDFIDIFVADGSGGIIKPADVAFGPDGNLYVTDEQGNKVYKYSSTDGSPLGAFASSGLSKPKYLIFQDGDLYVSSEENDKIIRYDGSTGLHKSDFVSNGSGGLDKPEGLVFGPYGDLYVSSEATDEVLRYDGTTGAFIEVFVSAGSGGVNEPADLVFGPDGKLYVSSEKGDEVLRYIAPTDPNYTTPENFTCPDTAINPGSTSEEKLCHIHTHSKLDHTDEDSDHQQDKHMHCHTGNENHHN